MVPVVRNVDKMSFADIEKAIANYGKAAKEGKLTMADMKGGTFTISNGGVFGGLMSTPIINPPQSAFSACTVSRTARWSATARS
jgi:2-oxoglutarate dehydrogenase E2 component (dihydrolipoamide succinyltransferase)